MSSAAALIDDSLNRSGWRIQEVRDQDAVERPVRAPRVFSVPLSSFHNDSRRIYCDRPVKVEIRVDDAGIQASCERLHVFANGDNISSALQDMQEQVLHFYDIYINKSPSEVSGIAARLRLLYVDHFFTR